MKVWNVQANLYGRCGIVSTEVRETGPVLISISSFGVKDKEILIS
jgi:hypothetical protein